MNCIFIDTLGIVRVVDVVVTQKSLLDALTDSGLISNDQLQIALIESGKSGKALDRTLLDLGFITEALLRDVNSEVSGSTAVELKNALPDAAALALLNDEFCRRCQLIPLSLSDGVLTVALADVHDLQIMDKLHRQLGTGIELRPVLASEREIIEAIDRFYGFELSIDGILHEIETGEQSSRSSGTPSQNSEYSQPFVRLVEAILIDAVKRSASDIHFEPEAGFIRVRYRIDGVMRQIRSLHYDNWSAIAVRLKVLSELNIAETRAPQDGRMSFDVAGSPIEFRVSVLPTIHGENIVLRILDRHKGIVPMEALGLGDKAFSALSVMMARPEGLILVTGPTGSGKTTTLYSMLNNISDERINIMTMEDPVEYPLPMLRQTTVNDQVKLDFATGIKAILRQDPDVILVGEIRDEETAEMALRASMTGHQVYSTLHANTAVGALTRLTDMGVSGSVISGNVIGIVGQRLVRKLCEHCKQQAPADDLEKQIVNADHVFSAVGCELCDQQGYKGRIAIVEVLRFNEELEEIIMSAGSVSDVLQVAAKGGYVTMMDDAIVKIIAGLTSIEEASRVIDFTKRVV